jgi:hypothetical protein
MIVNLSAFKNHLAALGLSTRTQHCYTFDITMFYRSFDDLIAANVTLFLATKLCEVQPNTVIRYAASLKIYCEFMVGTGALEFNFMHGIRVGQIVREHHRQRRNALNNASDTLIRGML